MGIASSCTSNEGDNRHLPLFIPPTGRIPFVGGIFSLFGLGVETSRSYYQHNQAVARTVTSNEKPKYVTVYPSYECRTLKLYVKV